MCLVTFTPLWFAIQKFPNTSSLPQLLEKLSRKTSHTIACFVGRDSKSKWVSWSSLWLWPLWPPWCLGTASRAPATATLSTCMSAWSSKCPASRNIVQKWETIDCNAKNCRLGFRWMMSSARRRTKTPSPRKWRPNVLRHLTQVVAQFSKQHISRLVNYFDINMETTVVPIDVISSCQECKTIRDVECRIVNIDKHGKYLPKVRWWQHRSHSSHNFSSRTFQKICTDVPTQKCVPVPVKVEAEKCVNIPTQTCQNVPVVANVPVPQKQCYRKPRWA